MSAQDQQFLEQWDKDLDLIETDKMKLYETMLAKHQQHPNDVNYCWRLVAAAIVVADNYDKQKKKSEANKWIEKSLEHAKKALEIDPNSMLAHKWYCAAVGRMAPLVGTKERIKMGHEFKEHRDIAVKLDNNDTLMHHMYGRWCYEVASLSFMERKIAETFIASPPKATYDEALESLMVADKQRPKWKMNYVWLAKTLIALKRHAEAMKWIDDGLALPSTSEEDAVNHIELEALEKSNAKYRGKK